MITEKHECDNQYKINLYKNNDDILLLDVFVDNKEKHIIKLASYTDNIIRYDKYKILIIHFMEHWKLGHDCEKAYKKIDSIKINLNKIFPSLKDYNIYNGDCIKNLISITLIKKDLLREFSPQIDENKILLRWW